MKIINMSKQPFNLHLILPIATFLFFYFYFDIKSKSSPWLFFFQKFKKWHVATNMPHDFFFLLHNISILLFF